MYFCANKSPRTLSENIYALMKKDFNGSPFKGARRPFDHYRPVESAWYIIPSAELPFFKFGKYYFEWGQQASQINCGMIFTKGLAPELAIVYPSKKGRRLIMDDSWTFSYLVKTCKDGSLQNAMKNIKQQLPETDLNIRFHGSYIDDPGLFDPYTEEKKLFDRYELAIDNAADRIKVASAVRQAMNLKLLNKVTDFSSLATAMEQIAADKFLWCDIFIGTTLTIGEENNEILPLENIISYLMQPLAGWIR